METVKYGGDRVSSRFQMEKEKTGRRWNFFLQTIFYGGSLGGWLVWCARWVGVDWVR